MLINYEDLWFEIEILLETCDPKDKETALYADLQAAINEFFANVN